MTIVRRGRGRARKTIELIAAIYAILEEIQPASVRAVCYRLFVAGLLPSMAKDHTDKISRLLVGAREDGTVPWQWVVDETRAVERINAWRDLAEFGDTVEHSYRKSYMAMQPCRIQVCAEKGTIRGTLASVLNRFGIDFRVMHGHGSATALYDLAQDSVQDEKPLIVPYIGDMDPSGMHMSEVDLPERIDRYGGRIQLIRVAIDHADTRPGSGVAHFPATDKAGDPRYKWFVDRYGDRCYEVDALDPRILRDRVEQTILKLIDRPTWDHAIQVEAVERQSMAEFMARWPATISMQAQKYPPGDAP